MTGIFCTSEPVIVVHPASLTSPDDKQNGPSVERCHSAVCTLFRWGRQRNTTNEEAEVTLSGARVEFCDVKVSIQTRATYILESQIGSLSRRLPIPVRCPKAILQASVVADNVSTRERPGETSKRSIFDRLCSVKMTLDFLLLQPSFRLIGLDDLTRF